ncbi:hypothetical protein PP460_gp081 [Streptomyces phage Muntaha]|nr:hypothetical protein PP460_gp081 [Streptomyces phage Muntaha]QIN94721.1 hypothetical protein SEA_MUNTAHA_197 [Streptomyces phage Muntaha]
MREIRLASTSITTSNGYGKVVRRDVAINSLELIVTLGQIMADSKESHTRNNLRKVMDMIRDLHPTI